MQVIDEAFNYVKTLFENESSGHDFYHTKRVYQLACHLANIEHANLFIVQLAALLHDVDDRKLSPETVLHKDNAVAFLKAHDIDEDSIQSIITIINEVSFVADDSITPSSLEGRCVQDADRLDAIGAIGIARTFAYGGHRHQKMYDPNILPLTAMDKETYYQHETTTINHFYEKLLKLEALMNTNEAKRIARHRTQLMQDYLDAFFNEWKGLDIKE